MPDNVHPLPAAGDPGGEQRDEARPTFRRGAPPVGLRGDRPLPAGNGRPEPVALVAPSARYAPADGQADPAVDPGPIGNGRARAAAYKQAGNAVHAPTARHAVAFALVGQVPDDVADAVAAQAALF